MPATYLNSGLLQDGAYATGDDVVDVGWGGLGGREGEFPSLVQEQLKPSQQFSGVLLVATDGEPVQPWGGCVQVQTHSRRGDGDTKILVLTLCLCVRACVHV